ncbi:MAG: von Willebrand factor type A domain-containing protein [Lacipirellulaceae bacterium]
MNDQPHTDHHDKLIDRALREAVGDETPPDLTERILTAASSSVQVSPATSESRKRRWFAYAVAASLVFVALGFILPSMEPASETARSAKTLPSNELSQPHQPSPSGKSSSGPPVDAKQARIMEIEAELVNIQSALEARVRDIGSAPKGLTPEETKIWTERPKDAIQKQMVQQVMKTKELQRELNALRGIDALEAPVRQFANLAEASESKLQASAQTSPGGQVPEAKMGLQGLINDAYAATPQERATLAIAPTSREKTGQYSVESGTLPGRDNSSIAYPDSDFWEDLTSRREKNTQAEVIRETQNEILELEGQFRARGGIGRNMQAPELVSVQKKLLEKRRYLNHLYEQLPPQHSNDRYTRIYENPFVKAKGQDALSTFSIDVDTASYANVRQFLNSGRLPPPDAVRLEELLNYFNYDYTPPTDDTPFAAHVEVAGCPWEPKHRLARIAIKGREVEQEKRPQSNLVFLIDVSGSMNQPNKLPLLVSGMKLLTRQLGENDRVAIVVYASSEGLALPSTRGDQQKTILAALEKLRAGGSTAGGAGIQLAYQVAQENFIKGGINRVILATDGDFNVGTTNTADLERLAESKAKDTGVFLTVLGFGRGNLNDAMMEAISGKGNGNYHYVDNEREARKVLVEEMNGTLVTIAKDVKIQVEFNPAKVAGYRLLGYENRMLEAKDFNDDKKDAGEIGAGHTVTALYEIVPAGVEMDAPPPEVDDLKYQKQKNGPKNQAEKLGQKSANLVESDDLLTLKLRYKQPDGEKSTKLEFPIADGGGSFSAATDDFKFASAVASFGMLLRDSEHRGDTSYAAVLEIAESALGKDKQGYRAEFLELVQRAKELAGE